MTKQMAILLSFICLTFGCHNSTANLNPNRMAGHSMPPAEQPGPSPRLSDIFTSYTVQPGDLMLCDYYFDLDAETAYHLLPRDIIEIKFPSAPELDQEQRIRPDGMISLPYVGEVKAAEATIEALRKDIIRKFSDELQDPEVYIVVKEYGQKIDNLKATLQSSYQNQNREVMVRVDGHATFPLIGEMAVSGKRLEQINGLIQSEYDAIISGLRVNVHLQSSPGAQICVLGAVGKPGFYAIQSPLLLPEAIALAGGFEIDADTSEILIIHKQENEIIHELVSMKALLKGRRDYSPSLVSHTDIIYVPQSSIANAAHLARQLSNLIFFRGWGIGGSYDLDDRLD